MFVTFAYLDAGTGSIILQAMMGGFAGLVVLSKLAWKSWFGARTATSNESFPANEVAA